MLANALWQRLERRNIREAKFNYLILDNRAEFDSIKSNRRCHGG
jgi:hypothetical protein